MIGLSSDPDVSVQIQSGSRVQNKLAIEIKGGTDKSNAQNRAGEAEKSHQKAKKQDFREFWTLIFKKGLNEMSLKQDSPTTNQWFDGARVLAEEGADSTEFRSRLCDVLGIRLK